MKQHVVPAWALYGERGYLGAVYDAATASELFTHTGELVVSIEYAPSYFGCWEDKQDVARVIGAEGRECPYCQRGYEFKEETDK